MCFTSSMSGTALALFASNNDDVSTEASTYIRGRVIDAASMREHAR